MEYDEAHGVDAYNCGAVLRKLLQIADNRSRPVIGARADLHPRPRDLYKKCEDDYGKTPECKPAYVVYAEKHGSLMEYGVYRDAHLTKYTCEGDICEASACSLDPFDW